MLHFPLQRWTTAAMQRSRVADWIQAGHLTHSARSTLPTHTDPWPTAPDWRAALNVGLLWLAALLISVGVIMFIAANWANAGNMLKIGGVEVLILVCAIVAQWQRRKPQVRDAALLTGAFATGGLLALVGQIYQTGADTAVLFGYWSLAMLPWVLVGTSPILWLLWAAVLSLATWLAVDTYNMKAYLPFALDPYLAVAVVNLVLLAAWEFASTRITWLGSRLGPRCLAALAITMLSWRALEFMNSISRSSMHLPGWSAWVLVLAVLGAIYYRVRRDLMMLAMIAMSVLVVFTWTGSRILFDQDFLAGLFGGAVLAVIQAAIYTGILRALAKRWQA
jgi:uncharacterized membrane protein